ncbi:MAG: polysaccharide biosynthesis/export family protein [Chlamydiota bacterium]|nr:polysaccharide biosynthesis/export family protein [Chlamydiota bacterium]
MKKNSYLYSLFTLVVFFLFCTFYHLDAISPTLKSNLINCSEGNQKAESTTSTREDVIRFYHSRSAHLIDTDDELLSEEETTWLTEFETLDEDNSSNIHDAKYKLRVGDSLYISVYGENDSLRKIQIEPDGKLSYLFAHGIVAVNLTVDQLRKQLETVISDYIKEPLVLVTPELFVPEYYAILGEVRAPGLKPIKGNATLLKAFAEAEGFTTRIYHDQTVHLVDFDRCFLARKGDCLLDVDFKKLVEGDFTQDISLEAGDYIYVAGNERQRIFVLGEVALPGVYDFFGKMSLVEALSLAGGTARDASTRVVVVRGAIQNPTRYLIDIRRILTGKACDFELRPSDIVYFPSRKFTNLRLLTKSAIRNFVGQIASQAGTSAFISTTPDASGLDAPTTDLDYGLLDHY